MKQPLNFAIIGTNFIVDSFLAGAAHEPRFRPYALYSRGREHGEAFAQKHRIPHCYTDLEALLSNPEIDALYVASPNALHAPQTLQALAHGKHVLCEKAFASNLSEARAMIAAAQERRLTLMEAMRTTQHPNFSAIRENLYKLGTIRRYFAQYCQYSSRYDSYKSGIVLNAFKPELSNGSLMDIGVYCLYPLVALFGKPQHIKANGYLLESGVDGEGSLIGHYPQMEAVCLFSKITNSGLFSEIQGEEGCMRIEGINDIRRVAIRYRNGKEEELTRSSQADDMYYELSAFINAIEQGAIEDSTNTHANTLAVIELMDEARRQMGVVFPADAEHPSQIPF